MTTMPERPGLGGPDDPRRVCHECRNDGYLNEDGLCEWCGTKCEECGARYWDDGNGLKGVCLECLEGAI